MSSRPHHCFAHVLTMLVVVGISCLSALQEVEGTAQQPQSGSSAWPMFGGSPSRNMVNLREKNLPIDWCVEDGKHKNVRWVAELGRASYLNTPVVAAGRVFVGSSNRGYNLKVDGQVQGKGDKAILVCLREKDGALLWQNVHDMPDSAVSGEGLCSTPTVDGDFVYYVTPGCELICAHVADGKIAWRYDMMKKMKVFPIRGGCHFMGNCSPLVVDDLVFVVTGNGRDPEDSGRFDPGAPSFAAFHKKNGELAWQCNLPGTHIIEASWSNPVHAVVNGKSQVIFPGGDGWLYGLDAKGGKVIWTFNCSPDPPTDTGLRPYFVATPVVYDQKVYVGIGAAPESPAAQVGHLFCIDITKTGDVSAAAGNLDPRAEVNRRSALVWHFGGPIEPKPAQGRRVHFGPTTSTAAVHDGLVYIAEPYGYLHCLDAATGLNCWQHDLQSGTWGSPYWVDGKVYLCTEDGEVSIFAHGRQKQLLAKLDVDDLCLSTPVAANGVLYVRTNSKLFALAVR
jgi:outer membrane protein assembly factor BamB